MQLESTEEPSAKGEKRGRTLKADQHGRAWKSNDLLPPLQVWLVIVFLLKLKIWHFKKRRRYLTF